ncbi:MAG: P-II family nitrogen regulator [Bacteroidetes bacterium]|nr:P-II family nitrogen regulator [Bacteroidota bacterium]MBU1115874.1 P-II family nitrogen regulator [Bacteroidota bacterium]MBU1797988.1 P-II family nitrogen regulator [Bacteroidota bacterium]
MKKIESIIRPHKLEELQSALQEAGFNGLTVSEVRGYGRQKGHTEIYRGSEYSLAFVPKIRIEIVCASEMCELAIGIILDTCKTGEIGDGKIFISQIDDAIRIRTGESGEAAL